VAGSVRGWQQGSMAGVQVCPVVPVAKVCRRLSRKICDRREQPRARYATRRQAEAAAAQWRYQRAQASRCSPARLHAVYGEYKGAPAVKGAIRVGVFFIGAMSYGAERDAHAKARILFQALMKAGLHMRTLRERNMFRPAADAR